MSYRHEVVSKLFDYIQSTESFYIVGAPSIGKTRLLDFLEKPGVKDYYLKDKSAQTAIVRVDLNRLVATKDEIFDFFELMLSSLLLEFSKQKTDEKPELKQDLEQMTGIASQVIQSRDPLLAVRLLELEVIRVCQIHDFKICFFFDEFDETYRSARREIFAILRAIRDANKPYLCYALFLRNLPVFLRKKSDVESFYELISRNLIGIGPYSREDTLEIIRQIAERRRQNIQPEIQNWIAATSGGHPGLVQALLSTVIENPASNNRLDEIEWFARQESVAEECRKIWDGLTDEERAGLSAFVRGSTDLPQPTLKILHAKGLLTRHANTCFSPLFELFIKDL
ncbi:MAG: hypothetical protein AB1846_18700 [Chloroflexota bacterium]